MCVLLLKLTCCVDDGEAESFAGSPSLAAVLPNSRHPVALWDGGLGSLDFLENRLLEERRREGGGASDGWRADGFVLNRSQQEMLLCQTQL